MTVFGSGTMPRNGGSPFDGWNPQNYLFTIFFLNPTTCTVQGRGEESLAASRSQGCALKQIGVASDHQSLLSE